MKQEFELREIDKTLLLALVQREAEDYQGRRDAEWVVGAFEQLVERIEQSATAINVIINSVGNAGALVRALSFDTNNKKAWANMDKATNLTITLCSCGQLEHLLHVTDKSIKS